MSLLSGRQYLTIKIVGRVLKGGLLDEGQVQCIYYLPSILPTMHSLYDAYQTFWWKFKDCFEIFFPV